ncbi:IS66 family insertion sequence element accessory protein TnpB [Paenirhodobacter sp.]|uniref:IS66 family insertion sequence element accessory protein TnpB n=1 Tax=Paenirhodobacter sp. TaxID=1965326 RepID=UPI003B508F1E
MIQRNGTPSSDQSASERVPLIGTRPPANFIKARSCKLAASWTPYTWPRPTRCRIKQNSCQGAIHTWFKRPWRKSGVCLFAKRLEKSSFCWPRIGHVRVQLNHAQLMALLDGLDWKRVRPVAVKAPVFAG